MAPSAIRESFDSAAAVVVKKHETVADAKEKTPLEAISLGEVLPGETRQKFFSELLIILGDKSEGLFYPAGARSIPST